MSYYNPSRILSYKRPYSVVVGIRSVGKTYAFTKLCIKKGLQLKEKAFVWVRRYQDDIDDIKGTFFDDMVINREFPEYDFSVRGNLMYAIERKNGKKFVIGEFIALSQAQRKKSSPRPTVKLVVFDEFLSEDEKYLTNEVNSFYSVCYSIFRTERPVRAILLANAVSIINPYFVAWNITSVTADFQATTNVAVENCDYESFKQQAKNSSFGKSIEGSEYASYSIDNKFLLDNVSGIIQRPKEPMQLQLNLKLHKVVIAMYLTKDNKWFFGKPTDMQAKMYTIYAEDSINGGAIFLDKKDEDYKKIITYVSKQYASGECLFESLEIKNEIVLIARLVIKNF